MNISNVFILKSMLRLFNKNIQQLSSCFIMPKKPRHHHAYRPMLQLSVSSLDASLTSLSVTAGLPLRIK